MISWKTSATELLGQQWASSFFPCGFPLLDSDSERITRLELSQLLQLKQTTLEITMVSWKTVDRRLYMECWAYNDMAQSFTEGFFFLISLERSLKTIMIYWPGLPGVSGTQWTGPNEAQQFWVGFLFLICLKRSLKTIMIQWPGLPGVSSRQWAGPMRPTHSVGVPLLVWIASWIIKVMELWADVYAQWVSPLQLWMVQAEKFWMVKCEEREKSWWCNGERHIFSENSDLTLCRMHGNKTLWQDE